MIWMVEEYISKRIVVVRAFRNHFFITEKFSTLAS